VVWSPDSRNMAFVRAGSDEQRRQIGMFNVDTKQLAFVTTDRYSASSPAFAPDGKWLYFLSARHFNLGNGSPWGDRNMGPVFDKRVGVYALALQADARFPFKPEDELSKPEAKPEEGKEKESDKAAPKKPEMPAVAYAGLKDRLYEVPLEPGNYKKLEVDAKRLYLLDGEDGKGILKTLAISRAMPKPELFVANVRDFGLTGDRKHLFYRTAARTGPGDMLIVEAGAKLPADVSKARVTVDDWSIRTDPRLEWTQMFNDAWRMHRDFLYDAKMRGVDWNAVRVRYAPLAARVTDRAELDDVLGMMVGEVGALHSQIRPGDMRRPPSEGTPAGLGAILARVPEGYRVERIYRGPRRATSATCC
jgi:tricorn protease